MVIMASASFSVSPPYLIDLGRFGVEVAHQFGVVGVERHQHALLVHDGGVVGNGVGGLHLVGPPVAERSGAGAVRGDLLGHLVAFQHVYERVRS